MTYSETVKTYYNLAKPGIIYGNLITATAGFFFASRWHNSYWLFVAMLTGTALVIGSGCVINNIIDKDIDKKMDRTKGRALVSGQINVETALRYGAILGLLGVLILGIFVGVLSMFVAIFGYITYVVIYGYAKRKTVYSTMIGSLAGAIPPLIGYTAITKTIDQAGVILVFILICWQLTHFYAIALYRKKDYQAANLPVWPIIKGDWSAQLQALGCIALFTVFSVSLFFLGYCGYIYFIATLVLGLGWLWYSLRLASREKSAAVWGRKVFLSSLVVILVISVSLAFGPVLA